MRFEVNQISKSPVMARFDVESTRQSMGNMVYELDPASGQWAWNGWCYGREVRIGPDVGASRDVLLDGVKLGRVYQGEGGEDDVGPRKVVLELADRSLCEYPFSKGLKGYRYPIFDGLRQVAEVAKGCKVKNDLHAFTVAVADDSYLHAALVFCCHMFACKWWHAGLAESGLMRWLSVRKTVPSVGDAYDAGFMDRV